jgi:cation transport ATPase
VSVLAWPLLVVALAGTAFAQPNGTLSIAALAAPVLVWAAGRRVVARARAGARRSAVTLGTLTVLATLAGAALWLAAKTPATDQAIWPLPTHGRRAALYLAFTGAPDLGSVSPVVAGLLGSARESLERLLGLSYDDALLDSIFSHFCVGK